MKRLLVLTLLVAAAPAARAEEPYLDFVRNLRKNYPDLALEYLTKLSQKPPPALARQLPLEMARTRLEIANATPELDERLALYKQAAAEFQDYLGKEATGSALASAIEMDLARVLVLQGRTQLSRALAEESASAQQTEADKARKVLEDGTARLIKAREKLEKQIPEAKGDQKKELEESRLQAQFEEALALLDQRRTYIKETEAAIRAQNALTNRATDAMSKVASLTQFDPKNQLAWEAKAWLVLLHLYRDKPTDSFETFKAIRDDSSPTAAIGKRLSRYFMLKVYARENLPPGILLPSEKPLDVIRLRAQEWVRDYPTHLKTPEGYGVQYKLAEIIASQAAAKPAGATKTAELNQAKKLCRDVEQGETEWTSRARQLKLGIMFEEKAFEKPIPTLTSFDDCYVRAQFEASRMEKDAEKLKGDELKAKRAERFNNIIAALTRGMTLTDKPPKPPEKDVLAARASLAYAYMARGASKDDTAKAIEMGDELAHIKTRPPESAKGAVYALGALADVLTDGERSGFGPEELKKFRDQFLKLAEFMKTSWPNDTPGDSARHQLALMHIRDTNYPLAVKELASLKPGYSGGVHAHYQLAMAALAAEEAKAEPAPGDPDKRPFRERAQIALETMPELSETADEGTNYTWLLAKMKLGQILFVAKKFEDLEALAVPLKGIAKDLKLPSPEARDVVESGFGGLVLYAKFGRADEAFKAGKLPEVAKALDPLIADAIADKAPELKKNVQLRWAIFGLALRAAIQDNQIEKANRVITAIQKTSAGDDAGDNSVKTLMQLCGLVKLQMDEMKRKNNNPELLIKAQNSFAALLDGMVKNQKLDLSQSYTVARTYSDLGKHKEAAKMLNAVPPPANKDDARAVQMHSQVRVEYARQLRLSKQLDEAEKEITALIGTPKEPGPAAKNIEARKEVIYLMQDQDKFGPAAMEWDKLVKGVQGVINQPGMKDQFLECYYNLTYCMVKSVGIAKDDTTKARLWKQAGGLITGLEKQQPDLGGDNWKAKFVDLMDTNPELKKEYEAGKPKAP